MNSHGDIGTCEQRREWLKNWFGRLADRLRLARVCCGDWQRVCDSDSTTIRLGLTGVFLDAPYRIKLKDGKANRDKTLYASDKNGECVVDRVIAYCQEKGQNPQIRIAACGYDGEGYEVLEADGWSVLSWKAQGGYGNRTESGKENAARERIWFSPACIPENKVADLFSFPAEDE